MPSSYVEFPNVTSLPNLVLIGPVISEKKFEMWTGKWMSTTTDAKWWQYITWPFSPDDRWQYITWPLSPDDRWQYITWPFSPDDRWQYITWPFSSDDIKINRLVWFMALNSTFNNISAILWQSVLLLEETGVHLTTISQQIGTDCTGSCKSNFHTITMAP